ncbi:hypothetical protein LCGC14_1038400 [marine sediment metagenome]|uniref:DUF2380 domain-containing protein n=1 Tax=marine sediment metagenome TaxID=412755 RepID=A0A0F9MX19_9ZZZZ|nr:DUF2380 domain-containing protein [Methylophaga sp.]HEC58515.1 DUF2380 domain-containing protein [Methylophaga sp.]
MQIHLKLFLFALSLLIINPVWADTKIAVPDFELLDLSLKLTDPQKVAELDAQEQQKLRDIEQFLRKGLSNKDGFSLVDISTEDRNAADKSTGYLFDCAKCAAELGLSHNADYILIGRLHKPTYLFSYLIVRVFDTHQNKLVKEFRSEVKGDPKVAIPGAVGNLVNKLDKALPH